jgi:hypothetical protein
MRALLIIQAEGMQDIGEPKISDLLGLGRAGALETSASPTTQVQPEILAI